MIERTFETPVPLRVEVSVPAGSIEVATVDGTQTTVVVDGDPRALENVRVDARARGGGHVVTVEAGRRGFLGVVRSGGDLRVSLTCPAGADLDVRTASADVDARGSFGRGTVKTASGDVALGDFAADLDVKTVSGDAKANSVGGALVAQTVSGDVRVDDAAGAVHAKSVSGDLRVGVASGEVGVVSVSGDIEVAVRRGSQLHVDANSVSGVLDSEVPLADAPVSDGGEGPLVELRARTVSGDFRVVRA